MHRSQDPIPFTVSPKWLRSHVCISHKGSRSPPAAAAAGEERGATVGPTERAGAAPAKAAVRGIGVPTAGNEGYFLPETMSLRHFQQQPDGF